LNEPIRAEWTGRRKLLIGEAGLILPAEVHA
jgi:hypothetical protein